MNKEHKILFLDIETSPNLGYSWGKWEQNIIEFKEDWHILSFSVKWLGEKNTEVYGLPDFIGYNKNKRDDKKLCEKLWKYFDEADVIVAHNGNAFDIKKSNARFVINGLTPPSPYKTIDTKLVAKKYFKFDSNSLNDLARQLGLGAKLKTGGFDLWLECMAGVKTSWKKMCDYNKQDVILLEKVYLALRSWINNHPRTSDEPINTVCPNCNGTKLQKRGVTRNKVATQQRWFCKSCGSWHSTKMDNNK